MYKTLVSLIIAASFTACSSPKSEATTEEKQDETQNTFVMKFTDKHTFAKPQEAKITHLNWQVKVDFDNKIIEGSATYNINVKEGVQEIFLDTKNDMEILAVNADGENTTYELGAFVEHLGNPLRIDITDQTKQISISYKTSPNAAALQWLSPQQTANKTAPFLFTQSQAILGRSWIPVQDGPGIRFTYEATVEVPAGLLALMSAENPTEKSHNGIYNFKMTQPVPAYLMALTVGDVEYKKLGAHTGIYAESSLMDKSAYEFAEMEDMLVGS